MKKKSALIFGLVLVILLSFGSGMVIGQTSNELPRVTTACETKTGLIHGFDDGFSIINKCSKGSRRIALGEKSNTTNDFNLGDVLFIGAETLLKDGSVISFTPDYINGKYYWEKTDRKVPVDTSEIVQWFGSSQENFFITKSGDVYAWTQTDTGNAWVKTDKTTY